MALNMAEDLAHLLALQKHAANEPMKVFPLSATPSPLTRKGSDILAQFQPLAEVNAPAVLHLRGMALKDTCDTTSFASTSATNSWALASTHGCSSYSLLSSEDDDVPEHQLELSMEGELSMPPGLLLETPTQRKEQPNLKLTSKNQKSTVMMRNLPNDYTRDMLVQLIDSQGFVGSYDFIYLPIDFERGVGLGYAFINFVSMQEMHRFRVHFHGFSAWAVPSRKVCDTSANGTQHGLAAHIARYRNSPVMHKSVADEFKPAIFVDGVRAPFPPPTKSIKQPKIICQKAN